MDYSPFISSVLSEASEIAMNNFGKIQGTTKEGDNNQVLTETDLAVGRHIVGKIKEQYPAHNIIDEEAGVIDNHSEYTWVIDPIDGTSNFANASPLFAIIVGLLYQNHPVAGGMALPYFEETYLAEKGKGAFLNGKQIHVSSEENMLKMLISYNVDGFQNNPEKTEIESRILKEIILNCRNLRSSGSMLDCMFLARGTYGGAHHRNTNIWDVVGTQIIVEEAGGVFTNFNGEPLDYKEHLKKAKENFPFCAGTPKLHKKLQEIIHKYID